jgi:heat shock protein HtpX
MPRAAAGVQAAPHAADTQDAIAPVLHPMLTVSSFIAGALAAAPAVTTWWEYRRLAQRGESAVFSERVAQIRGRVATVSGVAVALILIFLGHSAIWSIPLLLLGVACASHGPRKVFFGETWSLGQYIEWRTRLIVGTVGFWILLALTPAILLATPRSAQWGMTLALLAALLTWHHFYAKVLLVVVKATPLQRPDLDLFFAPVLHGTATVAPMLWRAGAPGGVFANALALPDRNRGGVLFFDTLLERLAPHEISAILAHEVAHLEHFDGRRVRRMYAVTTLAIAAIVCAAATLVVYAPARAWIASSFAPLVVLVGLALRASRMQAEETRSDRRAVELCGDPEALVSGLTHLHAIHHLPRRVSAETEEHATHPSLARRIRAIRQGAGERAAQRLLAPVMLLCSEPGRLAILEPNRLTLVWADPSAAGLLDDPIGVAKRIEATAYDQLTELRVSTAADATVRLTARTGDGRRWSVPLQSGEAARAQDALNIVDQLLAPPKPRTIGIPRRALALVALLVTAVLRTLWPILVPALLAVVRPTRRILVTLASALVVTAFMAGGDSRFDALRVLLLALLAGAAVWQSYRLPVTDTDSTTAVVAGPRSETIALAIPVVLGFAWTLAISRDLFALHVAARDTAWPTAALMALSVYLGLSPRAAQRRLAVVCGAITAAAVFVGSSAFLTRMVGDPLVAETQEFIEQSVVLTPVANALVDGGFDHVRLASDGRHFLLSEAGGEEETARRRHVVGTFDGWSRPMNAVDAALVGNDRVLLLDQRDGGTQLRTERIQGSGSGWTLKVPGEDAFRLATVTGGRWRLMNRHRNAFTRIDGRVGTTAVSRTNWDVQVGPSEYVSLHGAGAGNVGLGLAVEWSPSMLPWWWLRGWNFADKTTLLRVEGDETQRVATSRLQVSCADPTVTASDYLCFAFDGRVSRLWRYRVGDGCLEPVGRARGQFFFASQKTDTRATAMRDGFVSLIDLDAARITAFELPGNPGVMSYDVTDQFLAVSRIVGGQTAVELYRVEEAPAAAAFASTR